MFLCLLNWTWNTQIFNPIKTSCSLPEKTNLTKTSHTLSKTNKNQNKTLLKLSQKTRATKIFYTLLKITNATKILLCFPPKKTIDNKKIIISYTFLETSKAHQNTFPKTKNKRKKNNTTNISYTFPIKPTNNYVSVWINLIIYISF